MPKSCPTISKLADAIKPKLIDIIAVKPVSLTTEQIETEIQNRENLDTHLRFERQSSLDQMFPGRTNGKSYKPAPIVEFDF